MLRESNENSVSVRRDLGRNNFESSDDNGVEIYEEPSLDGLEGILGEFDESDLHSLVDLDVGFSTPSADDKNRLYFDESIGTLAWFIEKFINLAIKSKGDAIKVSGSGGSRRIKAWGRFEMYYRMMTWADESYVPEYCYSPPAILFYDVARHLNIFDKLNDHPNAPVVDENMGLTEGAILADLFNRFVDVVRVEYKARRVGRQIRKRRESAKENYKSGCDYFRWLVQKHSKLLAIRIDLAFKKEIARSVGIEEASRCFEKFLRRAGRRKAIFTHFVGYIAKLEFSRLKGYHYHLMLFFNGQLAMAHAYLGEQVGRCWRDDLTEGKGTYYNCNRHPNRYKRCGIGMIYRRDTIKQGNLLYALGYLTKSEQMVAVKTKKGKRTFFRGEMSECKSNVGRPRAAC
ncbi:Protein of uncharacterised function (DUF3296) [Burkholderia pseudomallei]|uniref:YagK/YfjJ domain-containing protein n=3 Tax=Burkholderia pseudomallei TaxID=28450 RepID=UPI0009B4BB9F|nr:inovirus-type Gp2 protein [Burkholderia pseudomallei]MCW0171156.1 inovirus Gp2 family protein [Burkholderia pseudomallei]CAJ2813623.1 Protein of uncharacterised function (DUF3296) [Burkholderia pseudomallei]CAJ2884059.1 Protein of uncharacterised function (DUF3296) [Burkholderia pseudomallei]CAJ3393053.1 Protein of uncharacterised function (DUF3296) [Burkholderia pseudomallei]CAJ3444424.1 Protein of uncharacterised function (DUF3296) [Burkholderia pseudomallei]